jgi:FKBP-type peptidyl-prolyl cis-trans isomerase
MNSERIFVACLVTFLSHCPVIMSKLRPIIPALIAGAVLALLVIAARTTQLAMHRAETAEEDPAAMNSMPNGLVEAERISQRFPDAQSLVKSGVRYIVTQPGEGELAVAGAEVSVHYRGTLWDGSEFDSSYDRGEPIRFPLARGKVIRGWDLGIADMRVGEKRTLIIPYSMAYGDRGRPPVIPVRATLIFDVELMAVE